MAKDQLTATARLCKFCHAPFVGHGNATGHQECMAAERKRQTAERDRRRREQSPAEWREKSKQWRERNPGYLAAKLKQWRAKKRNQSTCEKCGAEFAFNLADQGERRFCSRECAYAFHTSARIKREFAKKHSMASAPVIQACGPCNSNAVAMMGVMCGEGFERLKEGIEAAKLKASRDRARIRRREVKRAFRKTPEGKEQSRRSIAEWKKKNPAKVEAQRRRRQMKKDAAQIPYTRISIFVRDKWNCWICGKKTDKTKKAPHPDSPVVDHVIPLARDGDDTPDNVACAHWRCNSAKSSKVTTLF